MQNQSYFPSMYVSYTFRLRTNHKNLYVSYFQQLGVLVAGLLEHVFQLDIVICNRLETLLKNGENNIKSSKRATVQ
jgi:predicted RNA methylase